jgi:hypothetical protein
MRRTRWLWWVAAAYHLHATLHMHPFFLHGRVCKVVNLLLRFFFPFSLFFQFASFLARA